MSPDELKPSDLSDFTMEEAVVALPRRNAAGSELRIRVRAVTPAELLETFGGIPARQGLTEAAEDPDLAESERKRRVDEANARISKLVRAACVEPRIAVEPGDDGVPLASLHHDNREALIGAIYRLSGMALPDNAEAVLGFRVVERGGIALGGGAGEPVQAPA